MTPGEEAALARIGGPAPTGGGAPVTPASMEAPAQTNGEQIAARRIAEAPVDNRSWWQRHVTGEGAYEPDIPELGAAKIPEGAGWQVYTLPLTTSDPQARADILAKHIPGAKQDVDKYGNPIILLPGQGPEGKDIGKFYLNRPGISEADLQGFAADVATSLPAARAFAGIRGLGGLLLRGLGQGATQGVREVTAQKTGAETPWQQSAGNMVGALGGSVAGDAGSYALGSAIGKLSPTVKESTVGGLLDQAGVDFKNLPPPGKDRIINRLEGLTPGQAEAALKDSKNAQNLYRDALQQEFGPLTRGQIAGDAAQIGRDVRRGFVPSGQTDEVGSLLDQAQRKYWGANLLDTEGKKAADLTPATISKRLDGIIKDPEAANLFTPTEMAELRRGKDYVDLLREKGAPAEGAAWQMLQQIGMRIPSLALSLGGAAAGFHHGGLPWMGMAGLTGGTVGRSVEGATNQVARSMLARQAAQPPPLDLGPIPLPAQVPGLLGANLAVQSRGLMD